jgi:hypothetical protein
VTAVLPGRSPRRIYMTSHESLTSAYISPVRQSADIKVVK